VDDRLETEHALWVGEPCMENCKDTVEVTMRARVLDVTPEEENASEAAAATKPVAPTPEAVTLDPELVAAGEKVFRKCKSCHQIGDGAKNRAGPILTGIVGRPAASVDGFKYSEAITAMADDGLVWDEENLQAFLAKPKAFMKGTKMVFAGLRKDQDLAAITAYLSSVAE